MGEMDTDFAHVQRAEYMPEVVYVGRLDQEKLISGWDIPQSLENLRAVIEQIHSQVMSVGVPVIVDSTTEVLLQRMSRIARLIGLLSLLIALPLLWMAWLFAGNLSGLLMLNERRKLGLMRLRGVPGQLIGPLHVGEMDTDFAHVQRAEYMPEVVYVGRLDQEKLISGWDIPQSLENLRAVIEQIHSQVMSVGVPVIVDSTTEVLLQRMSRIARLIGLLSLLIALPLLWMAWLFAGNLSGLLMLNERRKLGLMRLRGVPGQLIGRAFLLAISVGGLLGGALGLTLGSVLPLMMYEGGDWPVWILTQPQQLLVFAAFLAITVGLALMSSRRLIRYATTISPLEASGRVAGSEALKAGVKFGPWELLCFVIGFYTLGSWISGYSLSLLFDLGLFMRIDQLLAFVGLPLFLYGIITLLVSRARWVQRLLGVIMRPVGGRLGTFSVQHLSVKPHRSFGFLLIVALVVSVSIYPTITSGSFGDKGVRGAQVQMGAQLLVTLNAPDLVDVEQLRGGLRVQLEALQPRVEDILSEVRKLEDVQSVTYMLEAVLPNFFLPNYGLRGVPIFLIDDVDAYLEKVPSRSPCWSPEPGGSNDCWA